MTAESIESLVPDTPTTVPGPGPAAPTRALRLLPPPQVDPRDREIWQAVALVEEAVDRLRASSEATWWLDVQAGRADPHCA